jgi:hypothetical protein
MRVALIHDYLCGLGGSERVFQYICEAFPQADVFTLAYNSESTLDAFRARKIRTTWLNGFVRSPASFRWSFPLATYAMESLDLGGLRYCSQLLCHGRKICEGAEGHSYLLLLYSNEGTLAVR